MSGNQFFIMTNDHQHESDFASLSSINCYLFAWFLVEHRTICKLSLENDLFSISLVKRLD